MSNIYVLAGPSFSGKSTVAAELGYKKIVTSTTRKPRPGEIHGIHYYFLSREEFGGGIKNNAFIEFVIYDGNYYGTSLESVQNSFVSNEDVLNVMDIEGTLKLKSLFPKTVTTIFLSADLQTLLARAGEREDDPSRIESRVEKLQDELSQAYRCDFSIKNEDLEKTIKTIRWLIAERL